MYLVAAPAGACFGMDMWQVTTPLPALILTFGVGFSAWLAAIFEVSDGECFPVTTPGCGLGTELSVAFLSIGGLISVARFPS